MARIELRVHAGVHLYFEFINNAGARMNNGQINGLSYDTSTGEIIPIGSIFSGDETRMYTNQVLGGTEKY